MMCVTQIHFMTTWNKINMLRKLDKSDMQNQLDTMAIK